MSQTFQRYTKSGPALPRAPFLTLLGMMTILLLGWTAIPANASETSTPNELSSLEEVEEYTPRSDEYKALFKFDDDGNMIVTVEVGDGNSLKATEDNKLLVINQSGKTQFEIDNLSTIEEKFDGATVHDWAVDDTRATLRISPPSDLSESEAAQFELEATNAYTKCMLDQGIGAGIAGAVTGCVGATIMASGVGCIAGAIGGGTAGYLGGVAAALWTCRDKL